jgi:hypothetical protein
MTNGPNEVVIDDEDGTTEGVVRLRNVHSEKYYEVWVVKFDDMPAFTYAIVNKDTGVIENLQPILANAKTLAKQFSSWLDGENPNEEALRLMSTSPVNH